MFSIMSYSGKCMHFDLSGDAVLGRGGDEGIGQDLR